MQAGHTASFLFITHFLSTHLLNLNISDMLDDDIVYLGTRINASTPPARSAQRPVTGERLPISQTQT